MPDEAREVIDERPRQEIAIVQPSRLPWNPVFTERYGIDPASWKALVEAVFPAAKTADSVALALSYCKARKLDPFKRVVHIVPVWDDDLGREVETVWPGIAEHRTTAMRTGLYAGADPAQYGADVEREFSGQTRRGAIKAKVRYPEWCQVTVYRLAAGQRVPVPGPRVYWTETYSAIGRSGVPNQRWQRAPYQMIEKCAEAAALRRAFPEEIGEQPVIEESRYEIDHAPQRADDPEPPRIVAPEPEEEPSYLVVDADGEEHEYRTAEAATSALAAVLRDARRRGRAALEAMHENNAAVMRSLPSDLRAELDPFGLPPLPDKPASTADYAKLFRSLEPPRRADLASDEPDWHRYAEGMIELIGRADAAAIAATLFSNLPHMKRLRASDGEEYRRVMDAVRARAAQPASAESAA